VWAFVSLAKLFVSRGKQKVSLGKQIVPALLFQNKQAVYQVLSSLERLFYGKNTFWGIWCVPKKVSAFS